MHGRVDMTRVLEAGHTVEIVRPHVKIGARGDVGAVDVVLLAISRVTTG